MKDVSVDKILSSSEGENIAIASAAVVYTKAFRMDKGEYFALFYKATSAGTPGLKIELETSWTLPATEGAADDNFVEAESLTDIEADLTTKTWHHKAITPPVCKYARLKITGSGTNPADTVLNAKIAQQQEF